MCNVGGIYFGWGMPNPSMCNGAPGTGTDNCYSGVRGRTYTGPNASPSESQTQAS